MNKKIMSEKSGADLEDTHALEFVEPHEPVALAGAAPRQMTGRSAGRVIGWGCRVDEDDEG